MMFKAIGVMCFITVAVGIFIAGIGIGSTMAPEKVAYVSCGQHTMTCAVEAPACVHPELITCKWVGIK